MKIMIFTLGLLTFTGIFNVAQAKVELYKPTILSNSPDGFISVEFEGRTVPNAKVAIDHENSIIIKSKYPLEKTEIPDSLKVFTKEYQKNLIAKREGAFKVKAGCSLYSKPKKEFKTKKKLKKETLVFGKSKSKKWVRLFFSKKSFYAKKSCLIRPKLDDLFLSPSTISASDGSFKLTATLPEGNIQLLFAVKKDQDLNHMIVLNVRKKQVTSNIQFISRPPIANTKKVIAEEPSKNELNWRFRAELGIGYYFQKLSQEVDLLSSIDFTDTKFPSVNFELAGNTNHFEIEATYNDASDEIEATVGSYTIEASDYPATSMGLVGRYYLAPLTEDSSTGFSLGYTVKTIPLFLVGSADTIDAGEMTLNYLNLGYVSYRKYTNNFSFPWQFNLLIPMSAKSTVGSNNNIDAQVSANLNISAQKLWYQKIYFSSELTFNYLVADFSYISGVTSGQGQVNLVSGQVDLKLGYMF